MTDASLHDPVAGGASVQAPSTSREKVEVETAPVGNASGVRTSAPIEQACSKAEISEMDVSHLEEKGLGGGGGGDGGGDDGGGGSDELTHVQNGEEQLPHTTQTEMADQLNSAQSAASSASPGEHVSPSTSVTTTGLISTQPAALVPRLALQGTMNLQGLRMGTPRTPHTPMSLQQQQQGASTPHVFLSFSRFPPQLTGTASATAPGPSFGAHSLGTVYGASTTAQGSLLIPRMPQTCSAACGGHGAPPSAAFAGFGPTSSPFASVDMYVGALFGSVGLPVSADCQIWAGGGSSGSLPSLAALKTYATSVDGTMSHSIIQACGDQVPATAAFSRSVGGSFSADPSSCQPSAGTPHDIESSANATFLVSSGSKLMEVPYAQTPATGADLKFAAGTPIYATADASTSSAVFRDSFPVTPTSSALTELPRLLTSGGDNPCAGGFVHQQPPLSGGHLCQSSALGDSTCQEAQGFSHSNSGHLFKVPRLFASSSSENILTTFTGSVAESPGIPQNVHVTAICEYERGTHHKRTTSCTGGTTYDPAAVASLSLATRAAAAVCPPPASQTAAALQMAASTNGGVAAFPMFSGSSKDRTARVADGTTTTTVVNPLFSSIHSNVHASFLSPTHFDQELAFPIDWTAVVEDSYTEPQLCLLRQTELPESHVPRPSESTSELCDADLAASDHFVGSAAIDGLAKNSPSPTDQPPQREGQQQPQQQQLRLQHRPIATQQQQQQQRCYVNSDRGTWLCSNRSPVSPAPNLVLSASQAFADDMITISNSKGATTVAPPLGEGATCACACVSAVTPPNSGDQCQTPTAPAASQPVSLVGSPLLFCTDPLSLNFTGSSSFDPLSHYGSSSTRCGDTVPPFDTSEDITSASKCNDLISKDAFAFDPGAGAPLPRGNVCSNTVDWCGGSGSSTYYLDFKERGSHSRGTGSLGGAAQLSVSSISTTTLTPSTCQTSIGGDNAPFVHVDETCRTLQTINSRQQQQQEEREASKQDVRRSDGRPADHGSAPFRNAANDKNSSNFRTEEQLTDLVCRLVDTDKRARAAQTSELLKQLSSLRDSGAQGLIGSVESIHTQHATNNGAELSADALAETVAPDAGGASQSRQDVTDFGRDSSKTGMVNDRARAEPFAQLAANQNRMRQGASQNWKAPARGSRASKSGEYLAENSANSCVRLFVGRIPKTFKSVDLKHVFSEFGEVVNCNIIRDRKTGLSKGCGFVRLESVSLAERAIKALNQTLSLDPSLGPMQVKYASGELERLNLPLTMQPGGECVKVFFGNLAVTTTESELKELFGRYGEFEELCILRDKNRRTKCSGFVTFKFSASADAAIEALDGKEHLPGAFKPLEVRLAESKAQRVQRWVRNGLQHQQHQQPTDRGRSLPAAPTSASCVDSFEGSTS